MATLMNTSLNQQGGGLLNNFDSFLQSPQAMALASSLLKSSGYSTMPTTFGQALGQGMADMDASKQQQVIDAYKKAATQQVLAQTKSEEQKNLLNEKMAALMGSPASAQGAPGSGLLGGQLNNAEYTRQLRVLGIFVRKYTLSIYYLIKLLSNTYSPYKMRLSQPIGLM